MNSNSAFIPISLQAAQESMSKESYCGFIGQPETGHKHCLAVSANCWKSPRGQSSTVAASVGMMND